MLRAREYISWSQLTIYEQDPELYVKVYIRGERMPINRGMALGSEIATALETGEPTGDLVKDLVIDGMGSLDLRDKMFKATIDDIPIVFRIDSASKDLDYIKEFKTGETKWTQKKADEHGQITFYCAGVRALTSKIPKAELVWAPTKKVNGKPELTGEIKRFKTNRTLTDILKMQARINKAWKGIGELCEREIL